MGSLEEKEIKAYRLKAKTTAKKVIAEDAIHDPEPAVCPVCATDEEKATATKVVAEDVITIQTLCIASGARKKSNEGHQALRFSCDLSRGQRNKVASLTKRDLKTCYTVQPAPAY